MEAKTLRDQRMEILSHYGNGRDVMWAECVWWY